jgi:hypothetical protein
MAEANYVSYKDCQYTSISPSAPQSKNIPNQPGNKYSDISLQYNYGTQEQPKISDFMMEWPEVYSNGGIIKKDEPTPDGKVKTSYSVQVTLPQSGETGVLIKRVNEVHAACAYIVGQYKGPLKMFDFDQNRPGALFKNPVYLPRDEQGNLREGKNPSIYLKLFKRGYGATEERTLFTDLEGKPIRWELLQGVEMKFIPLVHFEKIYIGGGKASLQMKVVSAVVTYVAARNTVTRQTDTIKNIVTTNPKAAETLAEQIAKLTMERQNIILSSMPKPAAAADGAANVQNVMRNLPQLGGQSSVGATVSTSDFLNSAPNLAKTGEASPAKLPAGLPSMPGVPPVPGMVKYQ